MLGPVEVHAAVPLVGGPLVEVAPLRERCHPGADGVRTFHRPDLGGLVGPNLTDNYWLHGCGVNEIVTSIKTGYPMKGMLPFGSDKPLTDEQLLQVASYVLSKQGTSPANPKPIDPERDVTCRRDK